MKLLFISTSCLSSYFSRVRVSTLTESDLCFYRASFKSFSMFLFIFWVLVTAICMDSISCFCFDIFSFSGKFLWANSSICSNLRSICLLASSSLFFYTSRWISNSFSFRFLYLSNSSFSFFWSFMLLSSYSRFAFSSISLMTRSR